VFEHGQVAVARPVQHETVVLGTVYLRAITEPFERRLARYVGIALLIIMAALLVIVLGAAMPPSAGPIFS
jgi:hypothetical protein